MSITPAFTLAAQTADPACVGRRLLAIRYSPDTIGQALNTVPELRDSILEVMKDPGIPRAIRQTLKRAIEDGGYPIVELTAELRAAWKVSPNSNAFAWHGDMPYGTFQLPGEPLSLNQKLSNPMKDSGQSSHSALDPKPLDRFIQGQNISASDSAPPASDGIPAGNWVAVQNRPITAKVNDLVTLVHELAHVRFESVLGKNLDRICRRLPASLAHQGPNGQWTLRASFRHYLHERFAFETDYAFMNSAVGRHFREWYEYYPEDWRTKNPGQISTAIAQFVRRAYEIPDPQIAILDIVPLSKILLGSQELVDGHEARQAIPKSSQPLDPLEFKIFRDLIQLPRKQLAADARRSKRRILLNLVDIAYTSQARARAILEAVIQRQERSPSGLRAILDILEMGAPEIGQDLGWDIPEKHPLTIEDLAHGHPEIRRLFSPGRIPEGPDLKAIQDILTLGFNTYPLRFEVPHPGDSFATLLGRAKTSRLETDRYNQRRHEFQLPLRELKDAPSREGFTSNYLLDLRASTHGLVQFWKNLGLENEFRRHFPNPSDIWASPDSLITLVRRLQSEKSRANERPLAPATTAVHPPEIAELSRRIIEGARRLENLQQKSDYIQSIGPSAQPEEMGEMNLGVYHVTTPDGRAVLKSDLGSAADQQYALLIHQYLGELGLAAKVKAIIPAPHILNAFENHQFFSEYERSSGRREKHGFGLVMEEIPGAWNFLKSDRIPEEIKRWNRSAIIAQIRAIETALNQLRIVPRDLQLAISTDGQVKLIDLTDFAFVSPDGKIFDDRDDNQRATGFKRVDLSKAISRFEAFYLRASQAR